MDKETIIFLHIPKTGGRSLQNIILRQYSDKEVITDAHEKLQEITAWSDEQKRDIHYIQGHFVFGIHNMFPQECKYITLLRDPVERVISHYYYIKRSPGHPLNRLVEEQRLDLEGYVTSGICDEVRNDQTRLIAGVDRGTSIGEGEMLRMAKNNMDKYFLVTGVIEQFDETLMLLKKRLKLRRIYYGIRNQTINRPSRDQIPASTLRLISERNKADIELYAHAKENLNRMIDSENASFRADVLRFKVINRPYFELFHLARTIKNKLQK
jgi:hypothetical protein